MTDPEKPSKNRGSRRSDVTASSKLPATEELTEKRGGLGKNGYHQFKGFGFEVPLPQWGVVAVTALIVLGVGATLWFTIVLPHIENDKRLISQDAYLQLAEYQKHFTEKPAYDSKVYEDKSGDLSIKVFSSDGCLHVTRTSVNPGVQPLLRWVLNPSSVPKDSPPTPKQADLSLSFKHEALAGNCLNPHPGQFRFWSNNQNGCWQQVWRQWPDGCEHYQFYNTCYGYFDPQVHWTLCYH
jgi:hypothetical protein